MIFFQADSGPNSYFLLCQTGGRVSSHLRHGELGQHQVTTKKIIKVQTLRTLRGTFPTTWRLGDLIGNRDSETMKIEEHPARLCVQDEYESLVRLRSGSHKDVRGLWSRLLSRYHNQKLPKSKLLPILPTSRPRPTPSLMLMLVYCC